MPLNDDIPGKLDDAINRLLDVSSDVECDSDEYRKLTDQLMKLYKAREIDSNLSIKELEYKERVENNQKQLELKLKELEARFKEIEINTLMKKTELELREREITTKLQEVGNSYEVQREELNLRQKEIDNSSRVKKDTLILVVANLAGIVLVLGYEKANVITSKALGFVTKLR